MSHSLLVLCFLSLISLTSWVHAVTDGSEEEPPVPQVQTPQGDLPIESAPVGTDGPSSVPTVPASAQGLFEAGLAAYQNQQFEEARDAFQKVVDEAALKAASPPPVSVLHNLALSAAQLNQRPYALALWRKALSIYPDFRPARAGRDFLETQYSMRPFERDSFGLWRRRALERFSIHQLLILQAILLGSVGWLGIRYWSARRLALETEMPLPAFPTVATLFFIVWLAGGVVVGFKLKEMYTDRATVIAVKTSARSLPSDEGVELFEVSGGSELLIRRMIDDWLQIQTPDGSSGWIKGSDAMVTSQR